MPYAFYTLIAHLVHQSDCFSPKCICWNFMAHSITINADVLSRLSKIWCFAFFWFIKQRICAFHLLIPFLASSKSWISSFLYLEYKKNVWCFSPCVVDYVLISTMKEKLLGLCYFFIVIIRFQSPKKLSVLPHSLKITPHHFFIPVNHT